MTDMKPTTIWILPKELKEAQLKAKNRDMSLSQLVRLLLRELPKKP